MGCVAARPYDATLDGGQADAAAGSAPAEPKTLLGSRAAASEEKREKHAVVSAEALQRKAAGTEDGESTRCSSRSAPWARPSPQDQESDDSCAMVRARRRARQRVAIYVEADAADAPAMARRTPHRKGTPFARREDVPGEEEEESTERRAAICEEAVRTKAEAEAERAVELPAARRVAGRRGTPFTRTSDAPPEEDGPRARVSDEATEQLQEAKRQRKEEGPSEGIRRCRARKPTPFARAAEIDAEIDAEDPLVNEDSLAKRVLFEASVNDGSVADSAGIAIARTRRRKATPFWRPGDPLPEGVSPQPAVTFEEGEGADGAPAEVVRRCKERKPTPFARAADIPHDAELDADGHTTEDVEAQAESDDGGVVEAVSPSRRGAPPDAGGAFSALAQRFCTGAPALDVWCASCPPVGTMRAVGEA